MITGVHISSSKMIIQKDDGKSDSLPKLTKNQVITAKVISQPAQGKAQLLINGKTVAAKTDLLLTPGEEVQLKVVQEQDAVVLKMTGPVQKMTTSQISSLIRFFSNTPTLPDIEDIKMPRVKDLLMKMSLKSDKPDHEFLPRLIEKGGMTWEKKIARVLLNESSSIDLKTRLSMLMKHDVKANLLTELLNKGPFGSDIAGPDGDRSSVPKAAASFLETMENFQSLNHHSSESGRYLLPFPVFSEVGFWFGQLLIDTGKNLKSGSKGNDRMINVSFLLDMTRLGSVRADFSIFKKEIYGRFQLADQETCDYVNSLISDLKARLSDKKYHVHHIECVVARPEDVQPGSLIEILVKSKDDKVLNIVA